MRKVLATALVGIGVLGGAAPVLARTSAAEPATESAPKDPAGHTPTYSDSVVVTASAAEVERQRLPASATVLDRSEIEERQAVSVAELITTVPGVTAVSSGPPGQVTSVFVRGAESDQVLLLWNGIELNDPYFGAVNWAFLPTDGVERVEVVRGPFSALYGGNAMGGVVNVLTDSPPGTNLRLEAGGDSYGLASLTSGYGTQRLRFDLAAGLRQGDSELENGFFDRAELLSRLAWAVAPWVEVGLVARSNDSETGIPLSGGQPSPQRRIEWRETQLALPVQVAGPSWNASAQLSRVELESAFRDPNDPFGFTRSDTNSEADRISLRASRQAEGPWWFAFGGESERLTVTDESTFGLNLDAADQRTRAAFGEAGWASGRLSLSAGLRRDNNDVFGGRNSLRTGVVVQLGERGRVWASYGEAFRPPTLGELFFPFSGNPELAPELSESWEAGVAWQVGNTELILTGFETRQTDLIDFDFVTFTNINIGRARSRGLEASGSTVAGPVRLRANVTYLDAEDRASELPLLRRADLTANLVAHLQLTSEASLAVTGRFVGDRPDVDPVTFARTENPSFVRFDLAGRWRLTERFAPYARLENLADEEYAEALGFPAPGRTWIGGVALSF